MSRSNCPCLPNLQSDVPRRDIQSSSSAVRCLSSTLVFEPTIVGTTTRRIFRIQNDGKEARSYVAQRDPNTNPIYHAFDFKLHKTIVSSGEFLDCIVTYSPKIANEQTVDYIQMIDNNLSVYKVCLKGECIGPSVAISIQTLYFYNTKCGQKLINTFEIRNTSSIPVAYEFEKNEDQQGMFKIDKLRGTLEPFGHVYITVRFEAVQIGFYSEYLVCKVLYHTPLIIELIGAQTKHLDLDIPQVRLRRFPQEDRKGFSFFLYDTLKTTTQKPPFSLTVNYLDFGRVEHQKNSTNSRTLVTSLTNHVTEDIEVVWEHGNKIFSITPQQIVIPSGESVLYEIEFRPDNADKLYSKIFAGCVYWSYFRSVLKEAVVVDAIDVPLTVTLKVIGHSFPENRRWLPRVEMIPNIIILPPAMPMSPTFATCMLQSSGHLPSLFKFIPPKKSNFIIKPMVGLIYDFQIVAIQLQPDLNDKKAYVERWGLELNGQCGESIAFYLKGYSEYASITVGVNNTVAFNAVHPGCQDITNVTIMNNSIHFLQYNFLLDKDSPFNMDHPQGHLASNESSIIQWYYTGNLRFPEVSTVKCEIQIVQNIKVFTGVPLDANINVYTKCIYSELCATPNHHDFGHILWGNIQATSFYLFNFGLSPIHFKLLPRKQPGATQHLNIIPTQGTVNPRDKIKITVQVKAAEIGHQEIQLMYRLRLNSVSKMIVPDQKGCNIFFTQFYSFYPTIQIDDISANNFGYLFSKVFLRDMFKIDEINALLRELQHDQTKDITIALPDSEMSEEFFFATLVIKNISTVSTEVKLKQHKLCDCKPVKTNKLLSFRVEVLKCTHRDMFKLTLSDELIEPNYPQTLKIEVRYLLHGLTKMSYSIIMSNNRQLNLHVNINVLPKVVTMASKYHHSYQFNLKSVYIGEREPAAQVFPLYNNSSFEIDYEMDTTPLTSFNFDYDFDIFECLNPKGTILPFSTKQLFLVFTPIEVRTYKVSVPLKMGNGEVNSNNLHVLQISGEGVLCQQTSETIESIPSSSKGMYFENLIELSTEHLVLEPFHTWSTVEKMIFIRNQTSDRVIGYSWQTSIVEGVVKAEPIYPKGVLQPKESHAVIIRITSFDVPSRLRLQMACKLLDHTQHIQHSESVAEYNRKQDELQGQFTITEKGTEIPINDLVILPKAEPFYVTLVISLCIINIFDSDLYLDVEKQMKQSPQYSLHLNIANIFTKYFNSLIPSKSKLYLPTVEDSDKIKEQKNPQVQKECCEVSLDKSDIRIYKTIIERIIADAIFSNYFCKIVDTTSNSAQPYYLQFTMDDQSSTDYTCKEIATSTQKCLEQRMEFVEDFLNTPQAPFLADIFQELIAESIHGLFQLGPQIKSRPNEPNTSYMKRSQNKSCPKCTCDNDLNFLTV